MATNTSTSNLAHKMILNQPAINWNVNYNGLDLITGYFAQINNSITHGRLKLD